VSQPPQRPARRPISRPAQPHERENWAFGWYEPDAPTIEMPALDIPLVEGWDRPQPDAPPAPDQAPPAEPGAPGEPAARGGPGGPDGPGGQVEAPPRPAAKPATTSSSNASLLVAAGIFISSTAGLVREVIIGRYLGTTASGDAFKAALRIPNFLQNLLGQGVLSASFIPVYARLRAEGRDEEAGRLAGAVAGLLILVTGFLSVAGLFLARPVTRLLATGFDGERFELTVRLVRIMFPGIGFLVLSAWCLGVLNSHRKFFLSYVAPVLWNAAQVTTLLVVAAGTTNTASMATALAWGVLFGGVLQFLVQLGPVRALLGRIRLNLDTGSGPVRSVLSRFGPVVLGRGVVQIMGFVDLWLASFLVEGGVSAFYFAMLLYMLPISMFGTGMAAAELPDLSSVEVYDRQTRQNFRRRLEESVARIAFYVAPCATMFVVVGDVIVRAVLQHGEFRAADTWAVWLILAAFSLGLLPTTSSRLLQNGLYALDDARTPARLAVVRVVIAAVVGLAFMFPMDRLLIGPGGVEGWSDVWALGPLPLSVRSNPTAPHLGAVALALGASIAAWIEYRMLSRALAWRIGRTRLAGRWLNPIAASCAAAGAVAYALVMVTGSLAGIPQAVVVLVPAGVTYMAVSRMLSVPEAVSLFDRAKTLRSRLGR
jgi:putative peptidoglycan lipid II flippase